jgi:hypothetical protein
MGNTIEYYDDELDETFVIPVFDDCAPEDFKVINDDAVYRAILKSLTTLSTRTDRESIPCFQINSTIFEVDRIGHREHLENCMIYFTKTEEYELCAILASLKDKLA